MFTTGLGEFNEVNKKTISALDYDLIKNKKTKVQYIIAIKLESKLVVNKEKAGLEKHFDFNHEDIMNNIEGYFTI